jgi:HSP20 family protein
MACCAVQRTEKKERAATVRPRVDILETASEFLLVADMPGVSPADVDLSFDKGELTLRGSRSGPRAVQFERTFSVSDVVAADRIAAEIKDGVLTVKLPKTEAVKPRKIAVHANN